MLFRARVVPLPLSSFPLHQGTHISWPKSSVTVAVQCLLPAVYNLQLCPPPPPAFSHTASAVLYVRADLIKHQWAVVWQKGVTSNKSLKPADDNVLTNALSLIRQFYDLSCRTRTPASTHVHDRKLSKVGMKNYAPANFANLKKDNNPEGFKKKPLRIKSCLVNVMQAGAHFYCRKGFGSMLTDRLCILHTQTVPQEMYRMLFTNAVNPSYKLFTTSKQLVGLKMGEQTWEKKESNRASRHHKHWSFVQQ